MYKTLCLKQLVLPQKSCMSMSKKTYMHVYEHTYTHILPPSHTFRFLSQLLLLILFSLLFTTYHLHAQTHQKEPKTDGNGPERPLSSGRFSLTGPGLQLDTGLEGYIYRRFHKMLLFSHLGISPLA